MTGIAGRTREEIDQLVNESLKMQPITELSNPLTTNIDLAANGQAILDLLEQTDREIIHGSQLSDIRTLGLKNDHELLHKLERLARLLASQVRRQLDDDQGQFRLVLSGCGTSGRLGFLCSQTMNEHLSQWTGRQTGEKVCEYVIAGDDFALVNSVESVEDKPAIGVQKLREVIYLDAARPVSVVYIGITCGLSAPFVAGQLDYCMNAGDPNVLACGIIGFNTVEMARQTASVNERGGGQSFRDLMLELKVREASEPNRYFVLNPLVGPEPITGSSRMKSGSATKIMLDMVATCAFHLAAFDAPKEADLPGLQMSEMLELYEQALAQVVYEPETKRQVGRLIDAGRASLANKLLGGSINYLSDSVRLGLLCCVDASECVPTYGAAKRDIRGFIAASAPGRYLANPDASPGKSWSGFVKTCSATWSQHILDDPELRDEFKSEHCLLVVIQDSSEAVAATSSADLPSAQAVLERLESLGSAAQIFHIDLAAPGQVEGEGKLVLSNLAKLLSRAREKVGAYFASCLQELVLKLLVNAISTGSHVLIGKTYENIMIDVRVSNIKLYWRAVGIIGRFGKTETSKAACEDLLLRSIYGVDTVTQELRDKSVEEHIETATGQEYVVPKALIMAITACSHQQAVKLLDESKNSVRNCIFKLEKNCQSNTK